MRCTRRGDVARRRAATVLFSTAFVCGWSEFAPAPAFAAVPPCVRTQLALHVEGAGASTFTVRSHSGALAVVTNTSAAACELSPVAALSMRGPDGGTVANGVIAGAPFMHPGPFVPPIALPAGGSAATRLRWVDGDVYDAGRAVRARAVALVLATVDGSVVRTIPSLTLLGDRTPVTFERERFTTALDSAQALGLPRRVSRDAS